MFPENSIAIFSPLKAEISSLLEVVQEPKYHEKLTVGKLWGKDVVMGWSGVGKDKVEHFFERFPLERCKGLFFVGCAGGIQLGVKPGDLFLCKPKYLWEKGNLEEQTLNYPSQWEKLVLSSSPAFKEGACVTTPKILRDPVEKESVGKMCPQGMLVEMENFHLAHYLSSKSLPVAFLRVILDPLEKPLPDFGDFSHRETPPILAIARNLLFHPFQMADLARLFPRCMKSLREGMEAIFARLE